MRAPARRALVVVAVMGTAATAAAVTFLHAPASDAWVLMTLSAGAASAVTAAGMVAGSVLRARPLTTQIAIIVGTATAAILAGALVAANAMFVSPHDLRVLLVVLAVGATTAFGAGVVLADRLGRASAEVQHLSARLADSHRDAISPGGALPAELADLRSQVIGTWEQLDAARERERAMDGSRRELVAWVSHDLRTPLSGIRAMVEALEDGVVDDPATIARYHTTIRQEADRLAQLVDDLFELSRIQAGALDLDLQRVGLADLVSDALAATGVVADARGVRLTGELGDPQPEVAGSVPDLARVLHNLLDNAIRHTPRGGRVQVAASTEGDHAVLSVRDSCGGIPADELDRVFDLAFRGDAARTPGQGGGGFGLAIARGLVEAHRGDIAVANEADGCRFTVRLPLGT